ncbi:MAG: leucine--tRNA ligase LeuS [Candidatus Parcubacteria bacterium]|jgi:leucyl-tRNA synthetase
MIEKKYIPKQFEKEMMDGWTDAKIYETDASIKNGREKMYTLVMFPYPSGAGLHVGHARVYTGTDVLARYYRMKNFNVLHPMGWDAFGLPAENAAIKSKKNPKDIVPHNIQTFKNQMKNLGLSYDWSRELATTDPNYYKWTQWLFEQFFKMGLLYKKMTPVYFCESCNTGLAEEEVLPNGTHERCGKPITRKLLPQWMFRITTYADRLLEELEGLDWPSGILQMQRNWIGKQKGLNVDFKTDTNETLTVWTKYWETVFGVTFLVVAPEHPWVQSIIQGAETSKEAKEVKEYVSTALSKSDQQRLKEEKQKTGVFSGHYAINPVNGEKIPVWVADYVLSSVGTGAVMGVPSHDERDFSFAKKYNLSTRQVVVYDIPDVDAKVAAGEGFFEGKGTLVNSGDFSGKSTPGEGKESMATWMIEKGMGEWYTTYHLRDWIFSRQRYWGEPIPMAFCEKCAADKITWWDTDDGKGFLKDYHNISKVNEDVQKNLYGWFIIDQQNLPVELPHLDSYEPSANGESPLASVPEWVKTVCPHCGGEASRETDTMPNWAGSCWYFLRFADPHNDKAAWSPESMKQWEPVDWYVGGAEHAVLHLLYARFWVKALQDLGMVDFSEPFLRLRNVGMVLAEDHHKMSKSLGNVINPDDVIAEYGADTLRVYEMFMAPFNQEISWSTTALQGAYRFLNRIWNLFDEREFIDNNTHEDKKLIAKLQHTIIKVTRDTADMKFNTAIASMMEFLNEWEACKHKHALSKSSAKKFLQILAPYAPFMTEKIWKDVLKESESIHISHWPEADESVLHQAEVKIPVQVNGKTRALIVVSAHNIEKDAVVHIAEQDPKVQKYIGGKIYEAIYIRARILNFVLKD